MKCFDQFISVRWCCNETQAVGMTASDWPVSHVVKRSQTIDPNPASLLSIVVSGLIMRLKRRSYAVIQTLKPHWVEKIIQNVRDLKCS